MFIKKYGDIIVGIVFAVIGLALIIAARMLPKSAVMEIGPDLMPTVVGTLILVLSVILLVQSVRELKDTSDDVIAWYEWIVQEMEKQDACLEAIKNVEMMPYYLSAADSEANDKAYLEVFQGIADSLAK